MKTKTKVFFSLFIFLCPLLSGCGFHLRSDSELPLQLRVLYLKSSDPYGPFTARLKKSLQAVGVRLVDSPKDAPATLEILGNTLSAPISSAGPSNQASVYIVTYSVALDLVDSKGKVIIPAQSVASSTTMIVTAQAPLGASNQLDIVSQQLQHDIIVKIFDLLSSPQAQQPINQSSTSEQKPAKHSSKKTRNN